MLGRADHGVQVAAYSGDTDGSRAYGASDAILAQRVITKLDTGFAAYASIDPVLIADVFRDRKLDARDAGRILRKANGQTVAEIPEIPPDLLTVTSFIPKSSGFHVRFDGAFEADGLNFYDADSIQLGGSDVMVAGQRSGAVRGSLVLDADHRGFTFVRTGRVLATDTYSVRLSSGPTAFRDVRGGLDGNADGVGGDEYRTSFVIDSGANAVLSVGDVVRGPGQAINAPVNGAGLPIVFSSTGGARTLEFALTYDPAALQVLGISAGNDLPSDATFESTMSVLPGRWQIRIAVPGGLPAGALQLLAVNAIVPSSAPYGLAHVLRVTDIRLDDGILPVHADDGIHVAAYLGDTNANQRYEEEDATLIQRVVVGTDSGFAEYVLIDPALTADTFADGSLDARDAGRIRRKAAGLIVPDVPALPRPPGEP